MSFPGYPSVCDSGVSWLGHLPDHWSVARVRQLFEIKKRIAGSLGYKVLSITQSGLRVKDIESNDGQLSMDYSKYQIVEPGDFAMNHMDLLTGWVDISGLKGVTSPDYRVFTKRSTAEIDRKFYLYIFQMAYTQKLFYPLGQGSSQLGRWRLPSDAFNGFSLPVPPREEQTAIASFIDCETAKIDVLAEEQQRLIALLKEKRQAIISHAVSKGLSPNAPMKDSGVEWLGEVPAHWKPIQLGRLCRQVSDGPHFSPRYVDNGVMFLSARNIRVDRWSLEDAKYVSQSDYDEFCRRVVPELGDVLYTKGGTTGIARVVDLPVKFQVWVHVAVLKLYRNLSEPYFVAYALNSRGCYEQSQIHTRGATNQDLGLTRLTKIWLALPPIQEQARIVQYLDEKTSIIDRLIKEAEAAIGLLHERRASLITAAVTGKIDVRAADKVPQFSIECLRTRGLIGVEIIERLGHQPTFGRVKLQKIAYLAEAHAGVSELGGNYSREAAGPLDRGMIRDMESEAAVLADIRVDQPGGRGTAVAYKLGRQQGAHRKKLADLLGADRTAKLDALIQNISTLDTKAAEAVATLYAVWNDALIEGEKLTDDEIIAAFLAEWHPEKAKKFRAHELQEWLSWMRRHDLVPIGSGPKTTTGRLFA